MDYIPPLPPFYSFQISVNYDNGGSRASALALAPITPELQRVGTLTRAGMRENKGIASYASHMVTAIPLFYLRSLVRVAHNGQESNMNTTEELIFCPRVRIVERQIATSENEYNDYYTIECMEEGCPFTRCPNIICLAHNNGLHIIRKK